MKEQQTNVELIVVDHINRNNYEEYIGETVKVTGDVDLNFLGLTKIPINFTEVGGGFYCDNNNLASLKGAPKEVGDNFYCSGNKLTSLEGGPEKVGGYFSCSDNQLTDLEGAPEKVGGSFACSKNQLTSFKGKPKIIGRNFIS